MAKNDNIAGVLSPTVAEHPVQHVPGYSPMNGPASPRYGHMGTSSPSLSREKPPPSKLSQQASRDSEGYPVFGSNLYTPKAAPRNSSPPGSGPDLAAHKHSPSIMSNLGQSPSVNVQSGLLASPLRTLGGHHGSTTAQTATNNLNTIAALISPNPENPSYDSSNFPILKEVQPTRQELTPWTQDEISRPKSADVALSSAGTPGSPHHAKPPSIGASITRYTSTPPPPGINISGATTQPTQAAAAAAANSHGPGHGLPNLLDVDPQYLYYDMPGSWASMANTPVNPIFSPLPTTFAGANAANSSAAKINAEIVNATAMKLAALSTVNGRVVLDEDVKKYQRGHKSAAPLDHVDDNVYKGPKSPAMSEFSRDADGKPGMPNKFRDKENDDSSGQVVRQQVVYPNSPMVAQSYLNAYNLPLQGLLSPNPANWGMGLGYDANAPASAHGYPSSPYRQQAKAANQSQDKGKSKPHNNKSTASTPKTGTSATGASATASAASSAPNEIDLTLLQDIGAWLKSLRLHKYTDALKDLTWQELVVLDDAALEARGVNALGARRKLLKVFESVNEAQKAGTLN